MLEHINLLNLKFLMLWYSHQQAVNFCFFMLFCFFLLHVVISWSESQKWPNHHKLPLNRIAGKDEAFAEQSFCAEPVRSSRSCLFNMCALRGKIPQDCMQTFCKNKNGDLSDASCTGKTYGVKGVTWVVMHSCRSVSTQLLMMRCELHPITEMVFHRDIKNIQMTREGSMQEKVYQI